MALNSIKWSILGLCEVRREDEQLIHLKSGHILYHYGETKGLYGVGFIVHKDIKKFVESFTYISERVVILELKINGREIKIIQVYAPTNSKDTTEEQVEEFFDDIQKALSDLNRKQEIIVMGDFNSQIGQGESYERPTIGKYCYGKRNARGERLLNFCQAHQLTILNTQFKCRVNRRWTWISPGDRYKTQVDYILVNKRNMFENCKIINKFNFYTDHRLLQADLKLKIKRKNYSANTCNEYDYTFNQQSADEIEVKLKKVISENKVQRVYDIIEEVIKQIMVKLKTKKPESTEKISSKTKILLDKREKFNSIENQTTNDREELKNIQNELKINMKLDIENFYNARIEKILATTASTKSMYIKT